jgi:nucleoside-diphosphate-sugar epimerase
VTRRALVTGSRGFIGRHFVEYLSQSLGYEVYAFDVQPSPGGEDRDANEFFHSEDAVAHIQYDLVVHAAYHVGGRVAIDGNPSVLALNLALDANMFDWAVRTRQRHVLYFSSSAVYPVELQTGKAGADRPFLLNESHACIDLPLLPDARYGWAKLTGEKLAQAAREQGLNVTVVRPFSGYGADQSDDYPFPSLIRRALRREDPFTIWGSECQVRDWIHIDDVVRGAMAAVEEDETTGMNTTVNLGTGIGTSMLDLTTRICGEVGYAPDIEVLRDKPLGVMERVADPTLLNTIYYPRIQLGDGIAEALDKMEITK